MLSIGVCMALGVTVCALPLQREAVDAGTTFLGALTDQDWGRPVASGDLDGDGFDEVIVAASESWGGIVSRVYIVRGGPDGQRRGVLDLSSNGADQVIVGAAVDDNLGSSIATGDVNGDGVADLLLCASNATYGTRTSCGIAYLIFGGAGFFNLGERPLSDAANWDVRFLGPVANGDMGGRNAFGGLDTQAAAIGRLNGDQYGDVVLGVHLANGSTTQAGRVYVKFGGNFWHGTTFDLVAGSGYNLVVMGKGQYDELGDFVLTADLTGDGLHELIIPNANYSQALFGTEGAVHIFRGRTTWSTTIFYLNSAPADITLLGYREYDELGSAAAAGDFNHDGIIDLAAAAPGADRGAHTTQRGDGIIYGLLGRTAWQTGTHLIDFATATADFLLVGELEENLGSLVAAGDFNGDGFDDLAAAEWFSGPQTNGSVDVLFGRAFTPGATFEAAVSTDLRIVGAPNDRIGFSLETADVNSDGLREILFGTPFNNADRGSVYVFTHVSGDTDRDGDVDLADLAAFQSCFTDDPADPGPVYGSCNAFDFDLDGDVDLADTAALLDLLTGPA